MSIKSTHLPINHPSINKERPHQSDDVEEVSRQGSRVIHRSNVSFQWLEAVKVFRFDPPMVRPIRTRCDDEP